MRQLPGLTENFESAALVFFFSFLFLFFFWGGGVWGSQFQFASLSLIFTYKKLLSIILVPKVWLDLEI